MHAVDGFFLAHAAEFLFGEGCLDRKGLEKFKRQIAECGRGVVGRDEVLDIVVEHIGDVDAYTFAEQGMMASRIYVGALLVHYVVIFEEAFAYAEVVFFHAFLSLLDGAGHHAALYHFALFEAKAVEHFGDMVGGEQAHQSVLERYVEH